MTKSLKSDFQKMAKTVMRSKSIAKKKIEQ